MKSFRYDNNNDKRKMSTDSIKKSGFYQPSKDKTLRSLGSNEVNI